MLVPFTACVLSILLGGGQKAGDGEAEPLTKLQGKWAATVVEINGNPLPEERTKAVRFLVHGNILAVVTGRGNVGVYKFTVDQAKTPMAIDLEGVEGPEKDRKYAGILRVKEKGFTICRDTTGKGDRPTVFSTDGKRGVVLEEWQRSEEGFSLADDQILLQGKWEPVKKGTGDDKKNTIHWIQIVKTVFTMSYLEDGNLLFQGTGFQGNEAMMKRHLTGTKLGVAIYRLEQGKLFVTVADGKFKGEWEFQRVSWR